MSKRRTSGSSEASVGDPGGLFLLAEDAVRAAQAGARVQEALRQSSLEACLQSAPQVELVCPGQLLASKPGGPIRPNQVGVTNPGAGTQIEGDHLRARSLGYLLLQAGELVVIPPLWTSPDGMSCHLVLLGDRGPDEIEAEWLPPLLEQSNIVHGHLEDWRAQTIEGAGGLACTVAQGTPVTHGSDGSTTFHVNLATRAGRVLDDGSIDLRDRNGTVRADEGQLICTLSEPVEGAPGLTVLGERVEADAPSPVPIEPGDNTVAAAVEGGTQIRSTIDGVVLLENDVLVVRPVLTIQGDVDYNVGNVEAGHDVIVQGSVLSGFRIEAGGSVTISGVIEDGGKVTAGGHVVVAQGIIGEQTLVSAAGDVETRYVQGARIECGGNAKIGSFLYNARVQADGDVVVQAAGGERGGTIVGGEVFSGGKLEARLLGSPTTASTIVGVRPPAEVARRLDSLRAAVDYCQTNSLRILRSLGLASPDAANIRRALATASEGRRGQMVDLLRKLSELLSRRDEAATSLAQTEAESLEHLEGGCVIVQSTALADVEVRLGSFIRRLDRTMGPIRYDWTPNGIREAASS